MADITNASATRAEIEPRALTECIYRIGQIMCQVGNLDELIRTILKECCDLMECEAASIALYDEEHRDLHFIWASGGREQEITAWRIPVGVGIVGKVAETRAAMISNDPRHDSAWLSRVDREQEFTTRNLLAVPMLWSEKFIGVLEALNRPAKFEESDLRLLQIFANQSAVAIEIQRAIKAKEENDRLAGFGAALADIGHSTKNILMRLMSPVSLIEKGIEQQNWELVCDPWRVMRRATDEINKLVLEMLECAKPRKPHFATTDMLGFAREIITLCRADALDRNIEIRLESALPEAAWEIDPEMTRPILMNLIGNSIEAIDGAKNSPGIITLEVLESGDERIINVRDNGPGIPAEILPDIFKPFFTHGKPRGTGLGLASVHKAMREQGGRVEVESSPDRGTTFSLRFTNHPAQPA